MCCLELPSLPSGHQSASRDGEVAVGGNYDFARVKTLECCLNVGWRYSFEHKFARREIDRSEAVRFAGKNCNEVVIASTIEPVLVEYCTRSNCFDYFAFDESLCLLGVFYLLTYRYSMSQLYEASEIIGRCFDRHSRQRHICRSAVVARRKREPESSGG